MANVAIFGGTFNPFHIGHYEILKSVCELDFIDKVLVMPDKIPPHKIFDSNIDDLHRQEMCRIACEDFDKAELCLIEFEREGKSYTVDTVKLLKNTYPSDNFFVVIGGDMLSSLDTWYKWEELIKLVSFITYERVGLAGYNDARLRLSNSGAQIVVINTEITDVSSTQLRNKIDSNLLPKKIYDYIAQKGIYND